MTLSFTEALFGAGQQALSFWLLDQSVETPSGASVKQIAARRAGAKASAGFRSTEARASLKPGEGCGSFVEGVFTTDSAQMPFRLYRPRQSVDAVGAPMPMIVMLHGGLQDASDFATGTAMNEVAEKNGCLVLYPEQSAASNHLRCWNWFDPAHQSRGEGEPGIIAGMTQHVLEHQNVDPRRVYIAGLSAGGAMAALMGQLYPDVFAAIGVHSGVASGVADGVASAMAAMRRGPDGDASTQMLAATLPTIVFQGNEDNTVHPDNGDHIVNVALRTQGATRLKKTQQVEDPTPGMGVSGESGRKAVRTRYSDESGRAHVEHWAVDGGPHAWSGGCPSGSFTDPDGPNASRAMMQFMLQHQLGGN